MYSRRHIQGQTGQAGQGSLARRPRVPSSSSREAVFEHHFLEMKRLYIDEDFTLKELKLHMQTAHGIDEATKQYKVQLDEWGLKKHLTVLDAAHVLRLLDQARSVRAEEVVIFSYKDKTRADILRYITRKRDISNEQDLLGNLPKYPVTPSYITFKDPRLEAQFPNWQHPVDHTESVPDIPTPFDGTYSASGPAEQTQFRQALQDSLNLVNYTDPWGSESIGWEHLTMVTNKQHNESSCLKGSIAVTRTNDKIPEFGFPNTTTPLWSSASGPDAAEDRDYTTDLQHAAMTPNPPILKDASEVFVGKKRFGDNSKCTELTVQMDGNNSAAQFFDSCLDWCISVGQDDNSVLDHTPQQYFNNAKVHFMWLMNDQNGGGAECFKALNTLVTFLECLGHAERTLKLLKMCYDLAWQWLGTDHPVTETINFKIEMLERRESKLEPEHNLTRLQRVYDQTILRYPGNLDASLPTKYSLVWAKLEMQKYEEARNDLEILASECAAHFGHIHFQTIIAFATLARATSKCGQVSDAAMIIEKEVSPRMESLFPPNHPYLWEARHRYAYFLFELAKQARTPIAKNSYLQQAEGIEREVLLIRQRILGFSNRKSQQSFTVLRMILQEKGDAGKKEADNLYRWCKRQLMASDGQG